MGQEFLVSISWEEAILEWAAGRSRTCRMKSYCCHSLKCISYCSSCTLRLNPSKQKVAVALITAAWQSDGKDALVAFPLTQVVGIRKGLHTPLYDLLILCFVPTF